MTKKIVLSICSVLFFACLASAQTTPASTGQEPSTPAEFTKKFFEIYSTQPQDAIDFIFSGEKVSKESKDDITAIKKNLKMTLGVAGDYVGYELITEKNVGNSYKLMSYLVKHDKQPIRFVFVYYKPKDKWKISTFQFNTNMDDELNDAAGVDKLKQNKE
ncbi:MAG TPA: hypothetical protein VK668_19755 [Mucilaginibacter sp.]|nr:hypothetical protein [Mucilaginibacter sp.]